MGRSRKRTVQLLLRSNSFGIYLVIFADISKIQYQLHHSHLLFQRSTILEFNLFDLLIVNRK